MVSAELLNRKEFDSGWKYISFNYSGIFNTFPLVGYEEINGTCK